MRAPLLPREFPEVFHARGNGRKSPGPSDASFRVRGSEASRMPGCRANPALVWPLTIDQSSCVKFGVFDGRLSIINDQLRGLVRSFTTRTRRSLVFSVNLRDLRVSVVKKMPCPLSNDYQLNSPNLTPWLL